MLTVKGVTMDNISIISVFEKYLRTEKGAAENTVASYMRDIKALSTFLADEYNSNIFDADDKMLNGFIDHLKEQGKSNATVSRSIASIKSVYNYLLANKLTAKDPSLNIATVKVDHKAPEILTNEEVELILAQPNGNDDKSIRDKAMLELLYATGMRVSELIGLNINDVNLDTKLVRCKTGNKERYIPMYAKAINSVKKYLYDVRPFIVYNNEDPALFVNMSGERMTRQGFWKIMKYYQKKANIDKDITPHTIRHSFAANLLENGADIYAVQEMMGHADIVSTQVYSNLIKKNVKDVYNSAHPRA